MAYEVGSGTAEERWRIERSLQEWADAHPAPYKPVLTFMGRDYSPHEIAREVKLQTELGEQLIAFLIYSAHRYETTPESFVNRATTANYREAPTHSRVSSALTRSIRTVNSLLRRRTRA